MNIERLRQLYPQGTRVECIQMEDPFHPIPAGTRGTVQFVDDAGSIHVSWDNGSGLALIPEEDEFCIVKQEYKEQDVNFKLKSQLQFKTEILLKDIQVDKAIQVDKKEFMDLLENPYSNRDYIGNNIKNMYVDGECYHCLMVYCDEINDGILIESEGSSYARYQGYVPNAKSYLNEQTQEQVQEQQLKVLVLEPNMKPYVAIIDSDLETLQGMVGGYIECVDLSDSATLVCNEEGKLYNLPANRRLNNDIICGRCFIVGQNFECENFLSLSQEDIELYSEKFKEVEMIDQSEVQNFIISDFIHG